MIVGVLCVQGDFAKHLAALRMLKIEGQEVRTPEELARCDRLIIPGGESTTVGLLLERYGLGNAIQERAAAGMPIWGTCMGMILMAKSVENSNQYCLGILDVEVRRNAFGSQVHSFEDSVEFEGLSDPVTAVFIRAPIVTKWGAEVSIKSKYKGSIVAVQQGNRLGTSFHPELTDDLGVHTYFNSL